MPETPCIRSPDPNLPPQTGQAQRVTRAIPRLRGTRGRPGSDQVYTRCNRRSKRTVEERGERVRPASSWSCTYAEPTQKRFSSYFFLRADLSFAIFIARTFFIIRRSVALSAALKVTLAIAEINSAVKISNSYFHRRAVGQTHHSSWVFV